MLAVLFFWEKHENYARNDELCAKIMLAQSIKA